MNEPLTALQEAAVQMHELFISYVEAGFTEEQALDLLKVILTAGMGNT